MTDQAPDAPGQRPRSRAIGDLDPGRPGGMKPIEAPEPAPAPRRRGRRPSIAPEEPAGDDTARRETVPVSVIIELNVAYPGGLGAVRAAFFEVFREVVTDAAPLADPYADPSEEVPVGLRRVSARLYQCVIPRPQLADLLRHDAERAEAKGGVGVGAIFKAWADYALEGQIDRSSPTVKADAARRAYAATGKRIVWAVMDTGIDATAPPLLRACRWRSATRSAPGEGPRTARVTGKSPTFGLPPRLHRYDRPRGGRPRPALAADGRVRVTAPTSPGSSRAAARTASTPHIATAYEPLDDRGRYVPRAGRPDPAAAAWRPTARW